MTLRHGCPRSVQVLQLGLACVIPVLVLAACTDSDPGDDEPEEPGDGTARAESEIEEGTEGELGALQGEWTLVDGEGPDGGDPLQGAEATATLIIEGTQARGQDPCGIGYSYIDDEQPDGDDVPGVRVDGDEIEFGLFDKEAMECPNDDAARANRAFEPVLENAERFTRDGDELRITGQEGFLVFAREDAG
ncbi:hypothetical protein ER308_11590 [Egibacter rhizosphaerae]|uniref:META domain-containing protein n=1 Tax=Egibacter rhizosphaerae TaxID=1670831 RepID=A0A411YG64_9ACTN|nr:hypothetical protein [Egibacter rhizosphaerae]QBI20141.1 hypothetical protein ER308_11590 [Egibacter rhizosphaerae]